MAGSQPGGSPGASQVSDGGFEKASSILGSHDAHNARALLTSLIDYALRPFEGTLESLEWARHWRYVAD